MLGIWHKYYLCYEVNKIFTLFVLAEVSLKMFRLVLFGWMLYLVYLVY